MTNVTRAVHREHMPDNINICRLQEKTIAPSLTIESLCYEHDDHDGGDEGTSKMTTR